MEDKTERFISTGKKILFIILAVATVIFMAAGAYLAFSMAPVKPNDDTKIVFSISEGMTTNEAIDELGKYGLVKNTWLLKLYVKFVNPKSIYAGDYELNKGMSAAQIIDIISNSNTSVSEDKTITFVEGKKLKVYVSKIAENFDYTEKEIMDKMNDKEFLNDVIKKYWFIDDSILDKDLYYPLEGYLFPDTYSFRSDASIEEIITTMLDGLGNKLSKYKSKIEEKKLSVHSLLTLASVVELEAVSAEDRLVVAGVFNNRINHTISLGSDVTTYYAVKKELTEPLTIGELNSCNAYNTRGNCARYGLPVGPICSPSVSSIVAAINPSQTDYYYFVADKNNKLYFGKNESEHLNNINSLKRSGLWPE